MMNYQIEEEHQIGQWAYTQGTNAVKKITPDSIFIARIGRPKHLKGKKKQHLLINARKKVVKNNFDLNGSYY